MSRAQHPSIIAQRTVSMLTGKPRERVQRYSAIDPTTVERPVGLGAPHQHAAAIVQAQARIHTTVRVIDDPEQGIRVEHRLPAWNFGLPSEWFNN